MTCRWAVRGEEAVDLPERADRGVENLGEMRALVSAVLHVATDETKAAADTDIETTLRHMREITKNAEHEMHAIILSCKRARRQTLAALCSDAPDATMLTRVYPRPGVPGSPRSQ
jgi:uncharacterized membrane protein